jgi:hypothetical protein
LAGASDWHRRQEPATGGGGYEEYQYTDDRATRIAIYYAKATDKPGNRLYPLAPYAVINAAYDDAGLSRLEIVWRAQLEPPALRVRPLLRRSPGSGHRRSRDRVGARLAELEQHDHPADNHITA